MSEYKPITPEELREQAEFQCEEVNYAAELDLLRAAETIERLRAERDAAEQARNEAQAARDGALQGVDALKAKLRNLEVACALREQERDEARAELAKRPPDAVATLIVKPCPGCVAAGELLDKMDKGDGVPVKLFRDWRREHLGAGDE